MGKPNNWYVFTGGPCSGKTTILKLLQKKGYTVTEEAARIYINQEIKAGKTLSQIRKDELRFQRLILRFKLIFEKLLPREAVVFFDRAIPDSIAYYKVCGLSHDDFLDKIVEQCYYKKVFLFELLEYSKDYARVEDEKTARLIGQLLEESYSTLGMHVIKVPRLPIEERLHFVLEHIKN